MRKIPTVRLIFATVIFIFAFAGSANAGEYKLAMCEDKELCNYVLKILNKDLKAAKTIRYNEHPEFLSWERIDNRSVDHIQNVDCFFRELCNTDINGDNKSECVIRLSVCLKGAISHSLFVYEQEKDLPCSDEKTFINKKLYLGIQKTGYIYLLKDLPKVPVPGMPGIKDYHAVAGHFVINLLRYGGKTFLTLTDKGYESMPQGEWFVVAEVTEDFQLNDRCYFRYKN